MSLPEKLAEASRLGYAVNTPECLMLQEVLNRLDAIEARFYPWTGDRPELPPPPVPVIQVEADQFGTDWKCCLECAAWSPVASNFCIGCGSKFPERFQVKRIDNDQKAKTSEDYICYGRTDRT